MISRDELAARLGVTPRTVMNWLASGCPCVAAGGEPHFDLEAVERWRQTKGLSGKPGRPRRPDDPPPASSAPAAPAPAHSPPVSPLTTRDAAERADAARKIAQARQQEHELQQEKGLERLDLAERIRAVTNADELVQLDLEVAALVGAGAMKHQRGQALRQLLAQAHRAMLARESVAEADEGLYLVTRQARELAQLFDRIGNGWRRRWLARATALHQEQDQLELPSWEGDMQPVLELLRIDPMGEPLDEDWPAGFAPSVPPATVAPQLTIDPKGNAGGSA